jgi:hypothetical protein
MRVLLACSVCLFLPVTSVFSGGQQLAVEVAPAGDSLLVRTYRCGTPADIAIVGTAQGLVAGQRRRVELKVTRTAEPGVFAVARQWPREGAWVLTFGVRGGAFVNALVELEPGPALRIASQESTTRPLARDRVASALERLSHP